MKIDDDIWPQVQNHRWKWQLGRVDTVGILWHATRSGIAGRTAEQEYSSTLNWFRSPNNVVRDSAGNPWYGGMSHYVIGGGKVAIAVPESCVPRFSAGIHDFRAISVEVAQATKDTPFDPRDIELCHELAQELSAKHGFPLGRIPFVDANNNGWPGEAGHEDTAQGRQSGKSDPSDLFWQAYEEAEMTPEQLLRIERLELAMFSGREEGGEDRATRLANAQFRAALRDTPGDPTGWQVSVSERVEAHIANHPTGSPGLNFGDVVTLAPPDNT